MSIDLYEKRARRFDTPPFFVPVFLIFETVRTNTE